VGHEEGGQLTEPVRRRPYSVVLLDELETGHEDVWNLLLQILEEGCLTDGQGRRVDFANTVVVMTANVGAKEITAAGAPLGFRAAGKESMDFEQVKKAVLHRARQLFRPELLNRMDGVLVFRPLGRRELRQIAERIVEETARRGAEQGVTLHITEEALEKLAEESCKREGGARPLRRLVRQWVEEPLADLLLTGAVGKGDTVEAEKSAEGLILVKKEESLVLAEKME